MSYATSAQVLGAMGKFTLGASTTPTLTQANTLIDDVSKEIDAILVGLGVAVPVTAPAAFLAYLATVNEYGATAAILKAMFPGAAGPGENPAFAFWEKRYQGALTDLRNGRTLDGSLVTSGVNLASTYLTDNPDNGGADEADGFSGAGWGTGQQPIFSMQREF